MARPRRDGTPSTTTHQEKIYQPSSRQSQTSDTRLLIAYDAHQRGLAVTVQPVSGKKFWKAIYYVNGFPRWYHIGAANLIGLADARKMAADDHAPGQRRARIRWR